MTAPPICPACGDMMNAFVLDFRDPQRKRVRWHCIPCGEVMQQQPIERAIPRAWPAFDDPDDHSYEEAVSW